ncbi:MAG: penicillin acylase family protein [Erythrobacter sp.]|uniref:penicillin acylase family protein n=1 Tax=Erythrobacter sp. TaxID=1042 RepID=UPI00262D29D5|nr:penicillin acylase family protein [Erythrobacter sp.]MDJ0978930.1 penicillin acylase family protein [Erythrobacter sp.]
MKWLIRVALLLVTLVVLTGVLLWFFLPRINDRQVNGEIAVAGGNAPIRIVRDSNSMPYIYAETLEDAFVGQGFVAGQDRLFQMELAKRAATGRLAEALGPGEDEAILNLDREARTVGFYRIAARQEAILSPESRAAMTAYLSGLNAFILQHADSHPIEFKLSGFEPQVWTTTELLATGFFLGWASAANFDGELIAHKVIMAVGEKKFGEIAPMVVNPDDEGEPTETAEPAQRPIRSARKTAPLSQWIKGGWREQGHGGSNNWAMSGAKAGQRAAIVTNDPHLDSRNLPGPWHPVALITSEHRIVGVSAGLPGVVIGRNQRIAFGVTNAYADAVDLYIETLDPENSENYLEGATSIPLEIIAEPILIKDETKAAGFRQETLTVRSTRRGPLITDHTDRGVGDAHISMRWASAEYMDGDLGLDTLMLAQDVDQALEAIEKTRIVSINFVVGDVTGRVARRASGAAPIRLRGDGMTPFPVTDTTDNWGGPIAPSEMPGEIDPARGWTGTANHMTAPRDYPYTYTSYASPPYRYRRMKEIFAADKVGAAEAWAAQYDVTNLYARELAPILARVLVQSQEAELREAGEVLQDWDHRDLADALAPTLFQEIARQLARQTFEDELGPEATQAYLSNWYVWQSRFEVMVREGTSDWFDDTRTPDKETLADLVHRAGSAALERLTQQYGADQANWVWGKVHAIRFQSPLRQSGLAGDLTGNRRVELGGSGETLLRALYPYDEPFGSKWFASLRMTADLSDPDKVRAVLPGGVVGRTFHPHLANQIDAWMEPDAQVYWWFSDEKIEADTQSTLTLTPVQLAGD